MKYYIGVILVTAVTTYLIRMLPLTLFDGKISSKRLSSFMNYLPYSVLSAMTFPAILYSTSAMASAVTGLMVAVLLAYRSKGLLTCAIGACVAVFITELIIL